MFSEVRWGCRQVRSWLPAGLPSNAMRSACRHIFSPLQAQGRRRYKNPWPSSTSPPHRSSSRCVVSKRMMSRGYRELRLEGLKNHPEAFSSSWEDESGKPDAWWAERLETSTVFAAGSTLRRCSGSLASGCMPPPNCGTRRVLWGMYVRPAARGTGLAACLVQRVIEHARPLVEEICLTVVAFKQRRLSPLQRSRLRTIRA
jgi:GNAT superfamily N-acetyltransferase